MYALLCDWVGRTIKGQCLIMRMWSCSDILQVKDWTQQKNKPMFLCLHPFYSILVRHILWSAYFLIKCCPGRREVSLSQQIMSYNHLDGRSLKVEQGEGFGVRASCCLSFCLCSAVRPQGHAILENLVTRNQSPAVNCGSYPAVKGQAMLGNLKLHVPTFETLL